MKNTYAVLALIAAVVGFAISTASATISYPVFTVGNPGNAPGAMSKGSTYDISESDVTLSQYTRFLNTVSSEHTSSLYARLLGSFVNIALALRSGGPGGSTDAASGDAQSPWTFESWDDAARFAKWLNDGQGTGLGEAAGSTEQRAGTLNGDVSNGFAVKNNNAKSWIQGEGEWFKAAYLDPNKVGQYPAYPTVSDSAPGNVVGTGTKQTNSNNELYSLALGSTFSNTQTFLTAGGVSSNSASPSGTFNQETAVSQRSAPVVGSGLGQQGSAGNVNVSQVALQSADVAPLGNISQGFRLTGIVSITPVPEPATWAWGVDAAVLAASALYRRKRVKA